MPTVLFRYAARDFAVSLDISENDTTYRTYTDKFSPVSMDFPRFEMSIAYIYGGNIFIYFRVYAAAEKSGKRLTAFRITNWRAEINKEKIMLIPQDFVLPNSFENSYRNLLGHHAEFRYVALSNPADDEALFMQLGENDKLEVELLYGDEKVNYNVPEKLVKKSVSLIKLFNDMRSGRIK